MQAALGFRSKGRQRRSQQIAKGFLVASPHTATHLVEVTQSEVLGLVDDNGIGIGDINTTFYDGGGKQHIVIIIDEIQYDLLQFGRFHLAMTDGNTAVGNMTLDHHFEFHKIGNTIIHEEYLSVAAHFEVDGIGYDFFIESMYFRLNGITVGRRSLDDAQIAGTHQ